jgi:hypothetical protein
MSQFSQISLHFKYEFRRAPDNAEVSFGVSDPNRMRTHPILLTALGILSLLLVGSPVAVAEEDSGKWYDTFDYADQTTLEEFWGNIEETKPPLLNRDPRQGDGHQARVTNGGSLVGKRTGPATDWFVKVNNASEYFGNYQRFGIRNADDSKHVLFYFDQPEPDRVRVDVRGGDEKVVYANRRTGGAEPSGLVTSIAGVWHFHVSKNDGVKVTLNGQTIFERGPEYAFEDENMVFVFGPHYGGAVVDFEYIATTEL